MLWPTRAMAFQRQLQVTLVLLCTAVFLRGAAQPYTLNVFRSSEDTNTITLECVNELNLPVTDPNVEYQYRPPSLTGGSLPVSVTLNGDDRRSVEFELTPQTEGVYFCRVDEVIESESQELVAFPERIEMMNAYTVQQGEDLALDCDFEEGELSNRYTFRWFRERSGTLDILYDGEETLDSMRFEVVLSTQNGRTLNSFRITGVEFGDESDEYYCVVTITNPGSNPFTATGRNIRVDVYDEVHIEMMAEPQVVLEDKTAVFECVFEGEPPPNIKWRLNGAEIQNGGDSGRFLIGSSSVQHSVTSTVTVRDTEAQDNGVIECEATNTNSLGAQFTAAFNTTLTVLSNNIDLFMTANTGQNNSIVYLHFMLPAEFPIPVTIRARYTDTKNTDQAFQDVYPDMFNNTMEINFRIPEVPGFDNFTTQVMFLAGGLTTLPILASEPIVIRGPVAVSSSDDNGLSTAEFIVVIVAATVIIIVVASIIGGVVCYCKRSPSLKPRIASDSGGPLPPPPQEILMALPWQALISTKDGPWQASWHLWYVYTKKTVTQTTDTSYIDEIEIDIEFEFESRTVTVDVPWQATLQELLPWEAIYPLTVNEPTVEKEIHFTYVYQYRVEVDFDAVIGRSGKAKERTNKSLNYQELQTETNETEDTDYETPNYINMHDETLV